jgi:hypothetical protein
MGYWVKSAERLLTFGAKPENRCVRLMEPMLVDAIEEPFSSPFLESTKGLTVERVRIMRSKPCLD